MSNHFHLIASSPKLNLSSAMNYFMRETSRQIGFRADRINQIYGSRFHRSLIKSHHYYLHAYKYVYRNPVAAKMCTRVEDYPYSTLQGLLGQQKLIIPVEEDLTLFSSLEETLVWLNQQPNDDYNNEVRKALKRQIFQFASTRNGRPSDLEKILL